MIRALDSILTEYRKKMGGIHTTWQKEKEKLEFPPNLNPTDQLKDGLSSHIQKFQRFLNRSEKYANSIIDMEKKRADLIDELREKDFKSSTHRLTFEEIRDKRLKEKAEIYEDKLRQIEEKNTKELRERRKKDKKLKTRLFTV
jgi:hypothetical protein